MKKNGFADSVLLPRKKKVKEEMYESKCMLALVKPTADTHFQNYPIKPNCWQRVTAVIS